MEIKFKEALMRVVAVVNQKGGAGKTTTVMNLAAVAAQSSKVLVVDADPQGSVTMWATNAEELPEKEQLQFDVATETDPEALTQMRDLDYDTVFVDTPGNLENIQVLKAIVGQSDFIVLPTEATPLALLPLVYTYEKIVQPFGLDYRVVITKADSRSPQDALDAQEMLREQGILVCNSFVRAYKAHERAPMYGTVVTSYEKTRNSEKATMDYKDVALELFSLWAKTRKG